MCPHIAYGLLNYFSDPVITNAFCSINGYVEISTLKGSNVAFLRGIKENKSNNSLKWLTNHITFNIIPSRIDVKGVSTK